MNNRPNILFLTHRVPYPPDKGDRIRTYHVLRYLAGRAGVHLASLADEPVTEASRQELRRLCARVEIVSVGRFRWVRAASSVLAGRTATQGLFSSPALRSVLGGWCRGTKFDCALASSSSLVPYLKQSELSETPAVVDLMDVDSQKWLDYAEASTGVKKRLYRMEGRRLRRLETDLPTWSRGVTLVSEAEADLYREFAGEGTVRAVANGVDLEYFQPNSGETPVLPGQHSCVFVGALDYRPNVDGACMFAEEVWPEVRKRFPEARFLLVGRRPTPAVEKLAQMSGIEVIGQVPDVRPYLRKATIVVVPLRIARGLQNKVLEAMAMGKAVVASAQALAGVQAQPGVHLLAALAPTGWIEAITCLFDDADLRRDLGQAGRRFVEERHCWDRCLEPMGELLGLKALSKEQSAVSDQRSVGSA